MLRRCLYVRSQIMLLVWSHGPTSSKRKVNEKATQWLPPRQAASAAMPMEEMSNLENNQLHHQKSANRLADRRIHGVWACK
jgi:hypothetical protein